MSKFQLFPHAVLSIVELSLKEKKLLGLPIAKIVFAM